MTHSITWRMATQDELERCEVTDQASLVDGTSAILRDGQLIGLCNEYGTAVYAANPGSTLAHDVVKEAIECFNEAAIGLC